MERLVIKKQPVRVSRISLPGLVNIGILVLLILLGSCANQSTSSYQFELLEGSETGLHNSNDLTPTLDLNVFNYMYFYNGGGVATGDFNNDGLADLYFVQNQKPNALYLNTGEFNFRDVSEESGAAGRLGWSTGVATVDINNDGLLDLYVSYVGKYRNIAGRNQLFVCQEIDENGIPHYEDQAPAYGLDFQGFSTQASFFDYDRDGDLDMFLLNHSLHHNGTFGQRKTFDNNPHMESGDRLYRNDGRSFTDVTAEAGIYSSVIGYGLGIATSDINHDGWPDLYVGNDFHENDYLYLNQQDGTFREVLTDQIRHTSRFSMGVDIADINNDGHAEILSLDMHPEDPYIVKSSLGEDSYGIFQFKLGYGYNHQYARNTLQLNNRNSTFSEIGLFSGVHATDWSWAPLFIDFDNDGFRDLFISNGIPKRMNDIDYVDFISNEEVQWKMKTDNMEETDLSLIDLLPEIKLPNKLFTNNQALKFQDLEGKIKNDKPSFSNGAAYADFDNDGDLDVIVNNISDAPFIYKNLTVENSESSRYVKIKLEGSPENVRAVGAKVIVTTADGKHIYENYPVRGYQSSSDELIHIGLGDARIESLAVVWPDGREKKLTLPAANEIIEVSWDPGLSPYKYQAEEQLPLLKEMNALSGLSVMHQENNFVEFYREQLMPHMVSAEGPAVAVADINSDGLDDLFFGGAKLQPGQILLQTNTGKWQRIAQSDLAQDSLMEDVDAVWIDVEGDGDPDLIVASGGNEFRETHPALRPRLYLNDGTGALSKSEEAFKEIGLSASCVLAHDINQDGYLDLFIGSRAVPWNYGQIPRSYLLMNDGSGKFSDVTDAYAPALSSAGIVRDGTWADINGDGRKDLLLALEWGPICFLLDQDGHYEKVDLDKTNGWWNFILPYDFDRDGDLDFFAGNLGLNSKICATESEPARMYVDDFDENGQIEQLLTCYMDGKETLFPTFREMVSQMPELKKRYLKAHDFAAADLREIISSEQLKNAVMYEAFVFENSYFENTGDLTFERRALPDRLQFAPLMAGALHDFDRDGSMDVLLGGNFHETNIEMGRYDADYGSILFNSGDGRWSETNMQQLSITGQIREITPLQFSGTDSFIIGRNDAQLLLYSVLDQQL